MRDRRGGKHGRTDTNATQAGRQAGRQTHTHNTHNTYIMCTHTYIHTYIHNEHTYTRYKNTDDLKLGIVEAVRFDIALRPRDSIVVVRETSVYVPALFPLHGEGVRVSE